MVRSIVVPPPRWSQRADESVEALLASLPPSLPDAFARLPAGAPGDFETLSDDLSAILLDLNLGLLVMNEQLEIKRTRGPVRAWLQTYFRMSSCVANLPEKLEQWVREVIAATEPPVRGQPLLTRTRCFEANDRQLWVQFSTGPRARELHLLLRERPRPGAHCSLEALGLSPREAEVLSWLAHGKSNHEIAHILGIAARTVHKHLEHIYARLGVENRTAAVARALENM